MLIVSPECIGVNESSIKEKMRVLEKAELFQAVSFVTRIAETVFSRNVQKAGAILFRPVYGPISTANRVVFLSNSSQL
jgi:hypothetical protein